MTTTETPLAGIALIREHIGMSAEFENWPDCYRHLASRIATLIELGLAIECEADYALRYQHGENAAQLKESMQNILALCRGPLHPTQPQAVTGRGE